MKRKLIEKLALWKDDHFRKPLLMRGARQVGKTYAVHDFAAIYFSDRYNHFNFEKNPELCRIFEKNLDPKRILSELELSSGKKIVPGEDLLFFDEVQECPKAIMSMRYFYEEMPEMHVIAAGSLIEFALKDISFPVGRIQMMNVYPMTFAEFLEATGNELLAGKMANAQFQFSETVLAKLTEEMYRYFIVGGMPECVQTYLNTGSYIKVTSVQNDLLATFRQDFSKYAGHADKRCLQQVFNAVAKKTGTQIKYAGLSDEFSIPTIKKALELLEMARIFTKVKSVSPEGTPLGAAASEKRFKTVFLDIGLLSCINGFYADTTLSKENLLAAFNGQMAEQFVGQELRYKYGELLHYWSREAKSSSAEVDYLIEKNGAILPVEVKSGKSGKLKSLHLLLSEYPHISEAFVLNENNYGDITEQRLHFKPLYYVMNL
ncbi:MAG: ATP-binding protein [Draconibacterium sp.]